MNKPPDVHIKHYTTWTCIFVLVLILLHMGIFFFCNDDSEHVGKADLCTAIRKVFLALKRLLPTTETCKDQQKWISKHYKLQMLKSLKIFLRIISIFEFYSVTYVLLQHQTGIRNSFLMLQSLLTLLAAWLLHTRHYCFSQWRQYE